MDIKIDKSEEEKAEFIKKLTQKDIYGIKKVKSGRNISSGNSEDSGGDMAALSVNPNCDGSSVQTESKAEEHTRVPGSSNDGFVPNESRSSAVGSSELSASSDLILQLLLNGSDGECESGEIKAAEACAARDGHIDSGPVSSPDGVRRSSNLEHTPGLQQDALPDGDMPVGQNGSGVCADVGKGSTVDPSVSNEWQRLSARPRDRLPMRRFPNEPSRVDLVSQEVTGPVTPGVANAFLAKHSINESLYQCSTEPRGAHAALSSANSGGSMLNRDFGTSSVQCTDNSLLALEPSVVEAERVPRAREERELFGGEIEKKEREIRELRTRKRREREARELEEASRWPQEQEAITGRSQWLCRHCRVRFPCCSHFFLMHRCHNNSRLLQPAFCSPTEVQLPYGADFIMGSLDSNPSSADARRRSAKAKTRIQEILEARNTEKAERWCRTCTNTCTNEGQAEEEDPICRRCFKHQYLGPASLSRHDECCFCRQIGEDIEKCRSSGGNMSAYFFSICKHFTSVDRNPCHCEKCGIYRIHNGKSFHCDVCNVCLDKRLEGKHKCRPDSGHDECCFCLEDAFSGCQILPCSHKVHRECARAMIQNGMLHQRQRTQTPQPSSNAARTTRSNHVTTAPKQESAQ